MINEFHAKTVKKTTLEELGNIATILLTWLLSKYKQTNNKEITTTPDVSKVIQGRIMRVCKQELEIIEIIVKTILSCIQIK